MKLQAVKNRSKFAYWALGLVLLLLAGCDENELTSEASTATEATPQAETKPVEEPILRRGIYASSFQLDPNFVSSSAEAAPLRDLFTGLVAYDNYGKVVPALAKSWFTENDKDWLFVLDDQAKWSNGEAVSAADVVASWQRLITPQNTSPLAQYLVYLCVNNAREILAGKLAPTELGVKALNANTLQISLTKANKQLIMMLGHIALLPTYQGKAPDMAHMITDGDYQLASASDTQLNLQAVKNTPFFAKVDYQLINAMSPALDLIENPARDQREDIVKLPRLCTYYYEFNLRDPELAKKEVRQAIKAMVLSSRIAQQYGLANYSVLPRSMREQGTNSWTPVIVEQLLAKAGITAAKPLKLTLTYDEQEQHSSVANQIIRTLGQSDLFRIEPQEVPFSKLLALREQKQFQMIRSGWCADSADPTQFLMHFHSASQDNKSHYANEAVDKQLERLKNEDLDENERQPLIQSVAQQIDNDVAILPLFQYQRRVQIAPNILGVEPNNDSEVIYSKHLYKTLED